MSISEKNLRKEKRVSIEYKDGYQICEATNKICYSQKESGRIVNRFTQGHQKKHYHKVPVRSYFCKDCRHFHLTYKYFGE